MQFFATAAKGTEPALRDELRELRLRRVRADRGGVHFEGDLADGFRACLWSRIAVRVLLHVGDVEAPDADALYAGVRAIDLSPYLTSRQTLAVSATCRSSTLTHTGFIAQKTKDAIVDPIRAATGQRPSVDRRDPDVHVVVHLVKNRAGIHLDLAGEPLHKRGWRRHGLGTPLKETLAASVVRLSGWDRTTPLVDPMCGSGTLAIEAALWSRDIAPGTLRRFGVERWAIAGELAGRLAEERLRARESVRNDGPPIVASDIDPRALEAARDNARAAGVALVAERRRVAELDATRPPGTIVVNPPYGERLEGGDEIYKELGTGLARVRGHRVAVLAGTPAIEKAIVGRPQARHTLFNGPIECRLLVY